MPETPSGRRCHGCPQCPLQQAGGRQIGHAAYREQSADRSEGLTTGCYGSGLGADPDCQAAVERHRQAARQSEPCWQDSTVGPAIGGRAPGSASSQASLEGAEPYETTHRETLAAVRGHVAHSRLLTGLHGCRGQLRCSRCRGEVPAAVVADHGKPRKGLRDRLGGVFASRVLSQRKMSRRVRHVLRGRLHGACGDGGLIEVAVGSFGAWVGGYRTFG